MLSPVILLLVAFAQGTGQPKRQQPAPKLEAPVMSVSNPTTVGWSYVRTHHASSLADLIAASKAGTIARSAFGGGIRDANWKKV